MLTAVQKEAGEPVEREGKKIDRDIERKCEGKAS